MSLRNIEFLIQESFVGIFRNGVMAVASISTVALSMAVLGAFLLLISGSHRFVERQLAGFQIMAFTPVDTSQEDAEELLSRIESLRLVKTATLLSRDAEYARFKRKLSANIDLQGVMGNPLPYAINVTSIDSRKTTELADQIRKLHGVDEVKNSEEIYSRVKGVADLVKLFGIAAALILSFTTLFVISNAIRLTLFARRHEIKTMQLVGATNWFIRIPLVVEGIVIGAIGALISVGLISAGSTYLTDVLMKKLPPMLRDLSSGIDPQTFIISLVAGGAVIGAMGSFVSIRRFLHN